MEARKHDGFCGAYNRKRFEVTWLPPFPSVKKPNFENPCEKSYKLKTPQ